MANRSLVRRRYHLTIGGLALLFSATWALNAAEDTADAKQSAAEGADKVLTLASKPSDCGGQQWPYIVPECLSAGWDEGEARVPSRVFMPEQAAEKVRGDPITRERLEATIIEIAEREPEERRAPTAGSPATSSAKGGPTTVTVVRGTERTEYLVPGE